MAAGELPLADTIPPIKVCMCGASYSADSWLDLELCGLQEDGDGGCVELRHCTCKSTIGIEIPRPPNLPPFVPPAPMTLAEAEAIIAECEAEQARRRRGH